MGLGGVGHRELTLATEPEDARGRERYGLVDSFGGSVRCGGRERNALVSSVFIGQGRHPRRPTRQVDGILQLAFAGCIKHRVHVRAESRTRSASPGP